LADVIAHRFTSARTYAWSRLSGNRSAIQLAQGASLRIETPQPLPRLWWVQARNLRVFGTHQLKELRQQSLGCDHHDRVLSNAHTSSYVEPWQ
jgi:hypothetical protein